MTSTAVGSINERGYLKGFKRRGYTDAKCLGELTANSLDSIDRKGGGSGVIRFDIGTEEIRMSDRGSEGMGRTEAAEMFDLHRENHASDASRGVSGIGAKPALSNLSGDRNMYLLTHKDGGEYLKVVIPWADIHRDGRYTGMVQVIPMTPGEAAAFGTGPGTTIVFPYSDMLSTLIRDNFTPLYEEDNTLTAPLDRIGVVFGREATPIQYVHHEEPGRVHELPKYNYFAGTDADYYLGIKRATIEHWYSKTEGKDRFICENQEIVRAGRGWSKDPCEKQTNTSGYVRVGEFRVLIGLRRDVAIFDEEAPALPKADQKYQNVYNTEHLGADTLEYLAPSKLVRNGQTIGLVPLADTNIANARAGGKASVAIKLVQCEIRFNPVSAQDNRQDNVMGIQENKNQFDGDSLPLNFTRLVKALRMKKADEIWDYFLQRVSPPADSDSEEETVVVTSVVAQMQGVVAPASESESESEPENEVAIAPPVAPAPPPAPAPAPAPSLGTEVRARLTSLVLNIVPSITYPPEILAHLAALEEYIVPS